MDNSIIIYYFYMFMVPIIAGIFICTCACCIFDRKKIISMITFKNISYKHSLNALLANNTKLLNSNNNDIKIITSNKKLDCFICFCKYTHPDCTILDCDHRIHTVCLLSWWCKSPLRIGECPMCRHNSSICLLELTKMTKSNNKIFNPSFIGFYRNDTEHKMLIRKSYNLPTTIIPIHPSLKNHTQSICEKLYNDSDETS